MDDVRQPRAVACRPSKEADSVLTEVRGIKTAHMALPSSFDLFHSAIAFDYGDLVGHAGLEPATLRLKGGRSTD